MSRWPGRAALPRGVGPRGVGRRLLVPPGPALLATLLLPLLPLLPVLPPGPGAGPAPHAAAAFALRAQGVQRPEVASLTFEGNESFSGDELAASILTRQTECLSLLLSPFCWVGVGFAVDRHYLSPRMLQDDFIRLHLFYRQRGYRAVGVDTLVTRSPEGAATVRFELEEGPPHRIASFSLRGVEGLGEPALGEDLSVVEGAPLDLVALEMVRDTLTRRLQNRGYAHAQVLRSIFIPAGTLGAEVEFDVFPGPVSRFGAIDVVGNEEVDDGVILRMLPFGEGGLYRRNLLFDAQRSIYNLEIFLDAAITEDLAAEPDSVVPLLVQVNEADRRRVRVGGGWNREDCFNAEASWSNRNYFGGVRELVVRGQLSNLLAGPLEESLCPGTGRGVYGDLDWVVAADFMQPFIFTPRNSLSASVYAERQSLRNIFVREALGVNLALTRLVGRETPLTLSFEPQIARLDAAEVFFCASFFVCNPLDIDLLQASSLIVPFRLSLLRNRTGGLLSPTGGYRFLLDLESVPEWADSDFAYDRAVADLSAYLGVGRNLVVAARLRGGWLEAGVFSGLSGAPASTERRIAHPERRFYAGGSNSVRGYAQNELGARVVSVPVARLLLAQVLPQGSAIEPVCAPEEILALTCSAAGLAETWLLVRPTGGTRLVEGSLELRTALWGTLGAAAFLDFGRVWEPVGGVEPPKMEYTPGIGLRYDTPIGPVRVDVGYRGTPVRDVPVVTSQIRPFDPSRGDVAADRLGSDRPEDEVLGWVEADDLALLRPSVRFGRAVAWWRGLQLHFSIGEAF